MKVIAIHGNIGSGKDTTLETLINLTGRKEIFNTVKFAESLKKTVSLLYNIPRELLEKQEIKSNGVIKYDTLEFSMINDIPKNSIVAKTVQNFVSLIKKNEFNFYVTVRVLLIYEGTEIGRDLRGKDFWVIQSNQYIKKDKINVITDLRFENELDYLKKRYEDLFLIKLIRSEVKTEHSTHPSEIMLPDNNFHTVIENDSTLENFILKIKKMIYEPLNQKKWW